MINDHLSLASQVQLAFSCSLKESRAKTMIHGPSRGCARLCPGGKWLSGLESSVSLSISCSDEEPVAQLIKSSFLAKRSPSPFSWCGNAFGEGLHFAAKDQDCWWWLSMVTSGALPWDVIVLCVCRDWDKVSVLRGVQVHTET